MEYSQKTFDNLSNLEGFSDKQIEVHQKLYAGYVTNTNNLVKKLREMVSSGNVGTPEFNEISRRLGWEFNGMRLHEYYFGNMKSNGGSEMPAGNLRSEIEKTWGSYANWENEFKKLGAVRGIGWVVLYKDETNGALYNFWIGDHHEGHLAGATPILVMDVWEHAYTVDWMATERPKYIDTFFKNIDWDVVGSRY